MTKIRMLVADDSAFMRKVIRSILESDPDIEVLDIARNGQQAVEKARALQPDIMTMDIEMPIMTGLEALKTIMSTDPRPVIMVSSLTTEGAQATVEALSLGAVDFLPKQPNPRGPALEQMKRELLAKVKSIASNRRLGRMMRTAKLPGANPLAGSGSATLPTTDSARGLSLQERISRRREALRQDRDQQEQPPALARSRSLLERIGAQRATAGTKAQVSGRKRPDPADVKIIVIGVSTGGPLALHSLLPRLPETLPVGIIIVQHMPPHFTRSLANRLNSLSHLEVKEAEHNDIFRPGKVFVAPGGLHLTMLRDKKTIQLSPNPSDTLHRPSVDITVRSIAEQFEGKALGLIMTGMGRDGFEGLKLLHEKGGYVLSQDEDSCVVYGMPKAVVEGGIADEIQPLQNLPEALASIVGSHAVEPRDPDSIY